MDSLGNNFLGLIYRFEIPKFSKKSYFPFNCKKRQSKRHNFEQIITYVTLRKKCSKSSKRGILVFFKHPRFQNLKMALEESICMLEC